jgi:hypothetical protein
MIELYGWLATRDLFAGCARHAGIVGAKSPLHSSSFYGCLTVLPILESIFFAIVGIELLLSVSSTLLWPGFSAHRYVPTTPLAKPTQPS